MCGAIIARFHPVVAADMLDGCSLLVFFASGPMDRSERRRLMHRGFGLFAVILGLSVLANVSVMLFAGASVLNEAKFWFPALILLGLGSWLWRKSRA